MPGRTDHSLQRQEGESLFCSGRAGGDRGAVGLGERLEDPRYGILPAAGGCSTDVAALLPGARCRAGRYEKGLADGLDRDGLDSARWAANRAINKRLWQVAHPYIMEPLDDGVSVPILLVLDFPDILPAIRKLSPEVRNGRFREYIDGIEGMFLRLAREMKAAGEATLELEEGKPAPDFTLKDINGRDLRLSSLFGRGKYVVVDFWGAWCSRCIEGFPAMERRTTTGTGSGRRLSAWRATTRGSARLFTRRSTGCYGKSCGRSPG